MDVKPTRESLASTPSTSRSSDCSSEPQLPIIRVKQEPIDNEEEEKMEYNKTKSATENFAVMKEHLRQAQERATNAEKERNDAQMQILEWLEKCSGFERRVISAELNEKKVMAQLEKEKEKNKKLDEDHDHEVEKSLANIERARNAMDRANKLEEELKVEKEKNRSDLREKEIERLKGIIEGNMKEMKKLEKELASHSDLAKRLADAEMTKMNVEVKYDKCEKRMKESELKLADSMSKLTEAGVIMAGLKSSLSESSVKLNEAEKKLIEKHGEKLAGLEKKLENARKLDSLLQDNRNIQNLLRDRDRQITLNNEMITKLRKENEDLEDRLRKLMDRLDNRKEEKHQHKHGISEKERNEWREKLQNLTHANNGLRIKLEAGEKAYEMLSNDRDELRHNLREAVVTSNTLPLQLEDLRKRYFDIDGINKMLYSRIDQEEKKREELEKREQERKEEEEKERKRREESEKAIEAERKKYAEAESELEDLRRINTFLVATPQGTLHKELIEAKRRIEKYESELKNRPSSSSSNDDELSRKKARMNDTASSASPSPPPFVLQATVVPGSIDKRKHHRYQPLGSTVAPSPPHPAVSNPVPAKFNKKKMNTMQK